MYIDAIIIVLLLALVLMFFRRFSSFVFSVAIIDIFLRILTFIKLNIGLADVSALIDKYIPANIITIIDKYTSGIVQTILEWAFVFIMTLFLVYIVKIFISKKKF